MSKLAAENCLHILNGDGMLPAFQEGGLGGDYLIWREALAMGPVSRAIDTSAFSAGRAAYFRERLSEAEDHYHQKVLREWEKLDEQEAYKACVLWFGAEYFCQVNLLGVLALLRARKVELPCYIISTDRYPGLGRIRCLGDLEPEQLASLFPQKRHVNASESELAARYWEWFTHPDPRTISLVPQAEGGWALPYLGQMRRAHLSRFPERNSGLSMPEWSILGLLSGKPLSRRELMGTLLRGDKTYGFGDLGWQELLDGMESLIGEDGDGRLHLNTEGREVFEKKKSFPVERRHPRWIGGARLEAYCFDMERHMLIALS